MKDECIEKRGEERREGLRQVSKRAEERRGAERSREDGRRMHRRKRRGAERREGLRQVI